MLYLVKYSLMPRSRRNSHSPLPPKRSIEQLGCLSCAERSTANCHLQLIGCQPCDPGKATRTTSKVLGRCLTPVRLTTKFATTGFRRRGMVCLRSGQRLAMAVNYADGTMFVSVPFYPLAAGMGAAKAGAGWCTIFFIPCGFAIGVGLTYLGRKLVYSIVGYGFNRTSKLPDNWIQQVAFAPFVLAYFVLPHVIIVAGCFGTWSGSMWVVEHFF